MIFLNGLFIFFIITKSSILSVIILSVLVVLILSIGYRLMSKDKRLYELLIEKSLAGIYSIRDHRLTYVNHRAASIFGYEPSEMVGRSILDFFPREEQSRLIENIRNLFEHNVMMLHSEYQAVKKDGTPIFIEVNGSLINENGKPSLMGSVNDITYQKQINSVLTFYDPLSSLPTLSLVHQMVNESIAKGEENPMAFLLIRLNRLTTIQRAYGHIMGEELMALFIEKMRSVVSKRDIITRYTDNKIIILIFNADKEQATMTAQRILNLLNESIHFENYDIIETANIGISLYPEFNTIDKLVETAHTALRSSLEKGTNQIQVFDHNLQRLFQERADIERDLDQAITKGEFVLYYQPKIDLTTGKINGMEALIRWVHPEKGILSPGVFIPLAERTGRIIPITKWVLQTVIAQLDEWEKVGLEHLVVSINISPLHFVQPDFVGDLDKTLRDSNIDPGRLELEITESVAIKIEESVDKINELKALGYQISIDDFGTGYSSLGQVNRLPVNKLKIDQAFMKKRLSESNNGSIVTTIITLAHNIGCRAIAEGVETKEQLAFLQTHGCDEAQGYLFSPPLPPHIIIERWSEIESVMAGINVQEALNG